MAKKRPESVRVFRFSNNSGVEYIVITDDEDDTPENNLLPGFRHEETHDAEIENAHMLPLGTILMRRD